MFHLRVSKISHLPGIALDCDVAFQHITSYDRLEKGFFLSKSESFNDWGGAGGCNKLVLVWETTTRK